MILGRATMATKDPLKKLVRKFPAPSELEKMLSKLSDMDDRGCAIVGASIREAILEKFLQRRLAVCDSVLAGQLFYNRGPLSDFHGKIIVSQAAGYISEHMANELLLVKSIRNAFAHAIVDVSFSSEEIQAKIDQSVMVQIVKDHTKDADIAIPLDSKMFVMIVRILVVGLDSDHQERGGDPLTQKFTRTPPADLPS